MHGIRHLEISLVFYAGFLLRVALGGRVQRHRTQKFKNPGMLNGPYCPQYGLMIALPWAVLTALHLEHGVVATLFSACFPACWSSSCSPGCCAAR